MSQHETIDRILDAATFLFAERGFAETSLRTITGMANVNLASVNYHFGSKKVLIQAVFSRALTPFCAKLDALLDDVQAQHTPTGVTAPILLRCLVDALFETTRQLNQDTPERFMRLLSMAYTQSQEHLRQHIMHQHGATHRRFSLLLSEACSGVDPVEFYWRSYFMLGAGVFTLSSFDAIRAILNTDLAADTSLEQVTEMMVSSMVGILTAPNTSSL